MALLDPELERLDREYDRISADLEHGNLSYDDALGALARLTTNDTAGNVWGLTKEGQWYSQAPGGPQQLADPAHFASPRSSVPTTGWSSPPAGPDQGAWGAPAGPPAGHVAAPPGQWDQPPPVAPPGQWGGEDLHSPPYTQRTQPAPSDQGGYPPGPPSWDAPPDQRSQPPSRNRGGASAAGVTAYLKGHAKVVIFVVVVVILGAWVITHSSKHTPTTAPTTPTSGIPVTPGSSVPVSTAPANTTPATTPPTTTSTPPTTTPPALPTNTDVSRLVTALASGNTNTASAAVVNPGSATQAAYSTATLYGQLRLLRISTSPATTTGTNTARQTWTLSSSSGTPVTKATVSLTKSAGAWKVTAWPSFGG